MKSELAWQAEKESLIRSIERQVKLRQFFIPGLFTLLLVLFSLGRETDSWLMITLGALFIIISACLFFSAALFIRKTKSLSLDQIAQILSGVFILEVLTIWTTFYLFAPMALVYNIPLSYLAIIFYVFYIILVAPFFKQNNVYQSFFYGLIWLALALLIHLNDNCRFLFDYGSARECPSQMAAESLLFVISGTAIFMVQFIVNHFHEQADWFAHRLKDINSGLQEKLKEEGYQVMRLKQEYGAFKSKMAAKVREKDNQIRELTAKFQGELEQEDTGGDRSEVKQTTEALLNILEDTEEARQRAEEEREKTLTIIDNFVDALLVVDAQGLIQMVNNRAREVFGLDSSIEGRALVELVKHPQLKPALEIILDGRKIKIVKRGGFEAGEGLFFEVSTVPLVQSEEVISYLIVFHDVSRERLVQRMKTEFVSIAAHQLRTPLSAIKWSLRILLDGEEGKLTKKQKKLMEKTYSSNQKMISLVNDLLNVSRIEEGRFLYDLEEVDLKETIKGVIEAVLGAAKRKKLKIVFHGDKKSYPAIKADREKITLAIQNIVDNAVKYSPGGKQIEISLEADGGFLLVSVRDNGIGIPRSQQSRVFQRFFRAGNAIGQETEGTGLGLFISRNVIEAHRGRIWFESQEGQGTTFYFTLPY